MSYFIKNGNTFRVTDTNSIDMHDHLPAGNYVIKVDQFEKLYLEQVDGFVMPNKIYGDCTKNADRILNTFLDRTQSTGAMLSGEKGSGKTLLAKCLSVNAAKQDIPTILINFPFFGDSFNKLIQDIDQPAIIMFDEFEKTYSDHEKQEQILTLLDGVFPTKKLFVLTCNDKWRIDSHMRNRPGRIFYMLEFFGLDVGFIQEYCEENLDNKEHIQTICNISSLYNEFNFDMLKAMVEEMNRYKESPHEVMKILNTKPEYDKGNSYKVELVVDNTPIEEDRLCITPGSGWQGNPLRSGFSIEFKMLDEDDELESGNALDSTAPEPPIGISPEREVSPNEIDWARANWYWESVNFTPEDMTTVNPQEGKFIFTNKGGRVVLTKIKTKITNYADLF